MPQYRRSCIPGATDFFTVVTANRRPILTSRQAILALRNSIANAKTRLPFTIDAWVVLPDHMHAIWTLPDGDHDYSRRWGHIKAGFTRQCGLKHHSEAGKYAGIWQPRFWEHTIRDEADWTAHMDYLHFNPVKHGLVSRVTDWPWSSFHRKVWQGWYAEDWGTSEPPEPSMGFGE